MKNEIKERIEMIRRGEVPEGYKKNKYAVLPDRWIENHLGSYVNVLKSGLSRHLSNKDIGIPVIRSTNINSDRVDFSDLKYWYLKDPQGSNVNDYILRDGDVLVNFINSIAQIGKVAIYENKIGRDVIYTTNILKLTLKEKLDSKYFMYYTQTSDYKHFILQITNPAVNQASFTTKDFKKMKLPIPSIEEQIRIAIILSTWDKAIELKEHLIEEKKNLRKSLMQKLLTGKVRLPGFEGEFSRKHLKGQLTEISLRNKNKFNRILSVTNHSGFIKQSQQFGKQVASKDTSNYKVVQRGQFAFNPSRVNVGSIDLLQTYDNGILSPMYVVFQTDENLLLASYLYYCLKSDSFYDQMKALLQGSVRQGLSFSALESIKFYIPNTDEQQAIVNILSTFDKMLDAYQQELDLLKQQKNGLMQLLLTGIVRVPVGKTAEEGETSEQKAV